MAAYTKDYLRSKGWDDARIQEWGEKSGKVFGVGARAAQDDRNNAPASAASAQQKLDQVGLGGRVRGTDVEEAYQTTNLRRDTDKETGGIRQTDTMRLLGNAGAGLDSLNASRFNAGSSALIYDDVTGNVYATDEWKDVSRNEQGWVDNRGKRFKGWGSAYGSEGEGDDEQALYGLKSEGEIDYEARKKGGHNMLAVFGDGGVPEAGTAEFQDWVRDEIRRSAQAQSTQNRYSSETGQFGEGTDLGGYGSITAADWIALGRPKAIGSHTIDADTLEDLNKYEDSQINGNHVIWTTDTKKRKSGLQKALGTDILKVASGVAGMFKGVSPWVYGVSKGLDAAHTYQETGSMEHVGKQFAISTGTDVATAALAAATAGVGGAAAGATSAASGAAASTGTLVSYGAHIGAAAAQGAVVSGGQSLAQSALSSVMYGGYDANATGKAFLRGAGTGAATGAISAGVGRFFQTSPAALRSNPPTAGSWQTGVAGELFNAVVSGGSAYGVNRLFGASYGEAGYSAVQGALGGVGTALGGAWAERGKDAPAFVRSAPAVVPGWQGYLQRFMDGAPALRGAEMLYGFGAGAAGAAFRKSPVRGGRSLKLLPEEEWYV